MTTLPTTHLAIAQWIRQQLTAAIHLDADLLEFAEAICGTDDPRVLFEDTEGSEVATFLDLVFQPTFEQHQAYEVQYGHLRISAGTVAKVLEILAASPLTAQIHFPGHKAPFALELPEQVLVAFVQRLKMDWSPPVRLFRIVESQLDNRQHPLIRTHLRHVRVTWHSRQLELLELFLDRFPMTSDRFQPCFQFMLQILAELKPQATLPDFFIQKKQSYHSALKKAEAFERRLKAGNMEMLMLQGERAAHGHPDQWRSQMDAVDQICMHLFGVAPHPDQPLARHFSVQTTAGGVDLDTLLHILK